jgi:recombinational DNA repair protein (RecF pathway)
MYNIYTTEAIVLKRENIGEADMLFGLITQDFGLIFAKARSIRKEKAKMRMHTQLYDLCNMSLVRGRYQWRLVGIDRVNALPLHNKQLIAYVRIGNFALRVLHVTEGKDEDGVFIIMRNARCQLCNTKDILEIEEIELFAVADILSALGYLDRLHIISAHKDKSVKANLIRLVNNTINESRLCYNMQ